MATKWMRPLLTGFLILFLPLLHAAEPPVPDELKAWRAWVLDGEDFRRCPFFAQSRAENNRQFVCAWPERLSLDLDARGGTFVQGWEVFAESWLELPGDFEHWPQDVRVNNAAAAVVLHEGSPHVRLQPGKYRLTGKFNWTTRPESLAVPRRTGIVELALDGREVVQPERVNDMVWLGKRRSAEQQEQLDIHVYRLVEDEIPVQLTTLIRLQVAGEAREALLAAPLPEGFRPLGITGLLPAQLEANGRLRVQLRPGSWEIRLLARGPGVLDALKAPKTEGTWAQEEVWSFAGNDRLRVVVVEGASAIDPTQAGVPAQWQEYPAFRLQPGEEVKVVERSRGLSTADENRLLLSRDLWLDFDHGGLTAVDRITGRMRRDWRLDMERPWQLLSATSSEQELLVTLGDKPERTGVELRSPTVDVEAVSRIEKGLAASATGWLTRFDNVEGNLHLPPGHRLLAAFGADESPWAWVERWRLLDMFLVLIVSLAMWRLAGWPAGVVALLGLALTRHDSGMQIWLWVNLLVAVVLARYAPAGWLRRTAMAWLVLGFLAVTAALLPFVGNQARLALYPQLEQESYSHSGLARMSYETPPAEMALEMQMPAEAPPPPVEAIVPPPEAAPVQVPMTKDGPQEIQVTREETMNADIRRNEMSPVNRYAPGTLIQAGPGVPQWRYNVYPYSWSGPVEAGQKVRFVILTPVWMALWRIAGCVLLVFLLAWLVQLSFPGRRILPAFVQWPRAGAAAAAMLLAFGLAPQDSHAYAPDPALLQQLKARLTRAPECTPECAEINAARVIARPDRVEVQLDISALADVAVPIPAAAGRWEPESIAVDGQTNAGLYRDERGVLWVALRPGAHTLRLSGRIVAAESVQLEFAMPPRRIDTSGEGWEFAGANNGRLLTGTLELVRRRAAATAGSAIEASKQFPPFVRVTRTLNLDLDWRVTTVVERLAPEKGAFTLEIPLLKGEQVITDGVETRDDRAVIAVLAAGERYMRWTSTLARSEALELVSEENTARTEIWSFNVGPQWGVKFEGTPAILPEDLASSPDAAAFGWSYEYHPRAGEQVKVHITRPQAAKGQTLAIDSVNLDVRAGKRSSDVTLAIGYRSTQGGRHSFLLPKNARVTSITSDGNSIALRPQNGELAMALAPGEHDLQVQWQTDEPLSARTQAPAVELRAPASNITTQLRLPEDRWVLLTWGPGIGPAILFWSELLVFIVMALLIGRSRHSPLRTHEWLLLGLGLSTFSWSVLLVFAVWIFVMRWRENWSADISWIRYNWRQVALALLSLVAIASLVSAIPNGLLGSPDMRVYASSPRDFSWFLDRTDNLLPRQNVISVSLWWYKAAMLLWALWLSSALLRWLPWAWRVYVKDGLWRPAPSDKRRAPAPEETPESPAGA